MRREQIDYISSTYQGKKVFITGHTGFKGSWLVSWLNFMGAEIRGFSLAPAGEEDLYYLINLKDSCDSEFADIRDKEKLQKAIHDFQPDFIFHLAAQPLVRLSYNAPIETYETNVIGTGNLLVSLQGLKKKCTVILITTDKVYHNREWFYPYRENDRLGGYDPYSSSKACCEILIDSFRNSFFNINEYSRHQKAIASARAGNVIGGGDWAKDRIIPDIIRSLRKGDAITVRNPNAVRPWQHVIEPLGGYLLLGSRLDNAPMRFSGSWNFGPLSNDNVSVQELVEQAIKVWGSGEYCTPNRTEELHEAGLLKLDINKAMKELDWKPAYSSTEAIEMTINWYKRFLAGENAKSLLLQDIKQYLAY